MNKIGLLSKGKAITACKLSGFLSSILCAALYFGLAVSAHSEGRSICENLRNENFPQTNIIVAEDVQAGLFDTPDGQSFKVPSFCRVRAAAKTSETSDIIFEVWLPSEPWSGRYHQFDSGGFRDSISYAGLAWRLNKGDAVTEVDSLGSWIGGAKDGNPGIAFFSDQEKVMDMVRGHRVAAKRAKAITTAFYKKAPNYAYFTGCSGGGYSALMEAQRNPSAWDGILVGAPANYMLRLILASKSSLHWLDKAGRIPPGKLPAIQQVALSSCSSAANVVDGIAADPRFCRYDPSILECKDRETDACLTPAQVKTLRALYQGPHFSDGSQIYPGFIPTMEAATTISIGSPNPVWAEKIIGGGGYNMFRSIYQYLFEKDAQWSAETFDFDKDYPKALTQEILGQPLVSLMEASDPDLSNFQNRGGKLLMYFGWGDYSLPPEAGINYVEHVAQRMGGHRKLQEFMKFYMVPGMLHCVGGPGANAFGQTPQGYNASHDYFARPLKDDAEHDIVRALESWVEEGKVPEKIIAAKYVEELPTQNVKFTRPLCVYPKIPVYKGKGSKNNAENFACADGQNPRGL